MIWTFLIFLIPFGLMLVPFVLGVVMSPESSSVVQFRIDAPLHEVWAALTRAETSGARIEGHTNEAGKPAWVEDIGLARIHVRTVESEFGTLLVRELRDDAVPMQATWRVELGESDGATLIRAKNVTHVGKGSWRAPLYRFLMHFLNGPRRALVHYFTRLSRSLGREPVIEDVE